MKVAVGHISTLNRIRKADKGQVNRIADSIKEVGLLNPITVTPSKVYFNGQQIDGYQLVAGLHRLEACKAIGWDEIDVQVLDLDAQRQIIAECDENLCGTQLTPSQKAEFTARRKEAYEALHPETVRGVAGAASRHGSASDNLSFAEDQAAKTGVDKRTVQRDAARGQQVCKEALEVLRGTKADTGTVLDMLKDLPPEAQVVAAYREVQKRQQAAPKAPPIAPDADNDDIALERQIDALMKAWNRAGPDARREFLGRIDSPLMDRRWE